MLSEFYTEDHRLSFLDLLPCFWAVLKNDSKYQEQRLDFLHNNSFVSLTECIHHLFQYVHIKNIVSVWNSKGFFSPFLSNFSLALFEK